MLRVSHTGKPECCAEVVFDFFFFLIGLMNTSQEIKNRAIKGKLSECHTE